MAAMPAVRAPWLLLVMVLILLGLACNLTGGLFADPTTTPAPTATATPFPTLTPTPTPQPEERLAFAEQALWIGDWESALAGFEIALQGAEDDEERGSAQLGIGTTHLRGGDFDLAEQELSEFIDLYPNHTDQARAHFLRGVARTEQEDGIGAIEDWQTYLNGGSTVINSTVYELVGDLYARSGQPEVATEHYQASLETERLGSYLPVHVKLANAWVAMGEREAAIERYDLVFENSTDPNTKATMNLLAGRSLEWLGQTEAAYERYLQSVAEFPSAYSSYEGLLTLVEAGVPVDDFQRGLVDYYAAAYQPALQAFNRVIESAPSAAAYYYRGLTLRELGDPGSAAGDFSYLIAAFPESNLVDQAWLERAFTERIYLDADQRAIDTYLEFVASRPESPSAAEALFAAGRTAERFGDLQAAARIWSRLATEYPVGLGHQGAFEAGIVHFRMEQYPQALESFQTARSIAPDSGRQSAAQVWIGKTHLALGDREAANLAWDQAAAADPTGYYSERARDLRQDREPFEPMGVFDFNVDSDAERLAAEEWLRTTFVVDGPEPLTELDQELLADPRLQRGREFYALGMFAEAKAEFDDLRAALASDAEGSYRLLHELLDLRLYSTAIFTARQILDLAGMDDAGTMNAPVYFNRIRFGPYFGELILPAAQENDIDGLLAMSVTRQESLFEGFVTSFAQARGLMQVIPATGQEIASQLGWPPDYTSDDLYRPIVSVRFGTYYLGRQADLFDGQPFPALAAYNGGPSNALAWHQLAPDDPDLFLEVIRIAETHLYLRRIYEVHSIYEELYVGN